MPANIVSSPVPAAASAVAQFVSNGASEPNTPAAEPFGALIQRLMVQQTIAATDASLPLLSVATAPGSEADTTAEDLSALLPFLDAMGLTQADATPPPTESLVEAAPADASLAILAGPASIPVANSPAISAAATTTDKRTMAQSVALPNLAPGQAKISADTTESALSAVSGDISQGKDLSAGREFSSQLVAAIADSKEQAHTPGSTAAVVQQIIATASPSPSPSP